MHIELYIPGLLAAPIRLADRLQLPALPALQTWFARAGSRLPAGTGRHGAFAAWLGVEKPPVAALHWLAATGERPRQHLLLAQAVHLQAGIDDLILLATEWLAPADEEQRALGEALGAHFSEVRLAGGDIFIELSADSRPGTYAPYRAQGRRIGPYLPSGEAALRMHAWMNEAQMLLHSHPVNERRRSEGRMALNGIWLWGEGELPEIVDISGSVYARTPAMRGFAGFLTTEADVTPSSFDAVTFGGKKVFIEIDDAAGCLDADDPDAWAESLRRIERNWLAQILDAMRAGQVQSACLHGSDGFAYTLTRKDLRKFWRRGSFARFKPQLHFED